MFNRAEAKALAKATIGGNFGIAFGTLFVGGLITGAAGTFGGIGALIIAGPMAVGLAIVYLELTRGMQCEFADMFKGFNNFGTNCIAGVLISIFTFLWSLLFVIPGIVKAYSYAMVPYILTDRPDLSATEAITESRRMMDGHKADLFVLDLSFIGWYILCALSFGLASIYVLPYVTATKTRFYEAIKG